MILNSRFVFFGTPEFAATILEKLISSGFVPEAVVCNPDRPVGRKKVITPPPVKLLIMKQEARIKKQVKIFQPEKLDKQFLDSLFLIHDSFDFFVVAAYSQILPKEIIEIPRLGTIGVHPSLLPKYRGASPIQGAILNGEKETGVTLYLMDEKTDHGKIVSSIRYQVSGNENYKTLEKELAELAGNLLVETLPKFIKGEIKPVPQDESKATYTKKFTTEDAFIDEKTLEEALNGENEETAEKIYRKILALNPEPGTWTYARALEHSNVLENVGMSSSGKRIKILEAKIENGKLVLKKIQIEGEKPKAV